MLLQHIQSIAIIIGVVIGAASAYIAVRTHRSNHAHQKVDRLHKLLMRYWELMFTKLRGSEQILMDLLPHDKKNQSPASIPVIDRQHFIGFFKEVGILVEDGAIDKRHAFYLFAYFAIRCEENEAFWTGGLVKDSIYWKPFHDFVEKMRETEEDIIRGHGEATEN